MSITYPDDSHRPTPSLQDPELVRERLREWLAETMGDPGLRVSPVEIPEGNGMSNITVLFDLNYTRDGLEHNISVVGRIGAEGEKLVFPEYDLAMQYAFMAFLEKQKNVPSPVLIAENCDGAILGTPFYLMEKTPGRIPTDSPPYHREGWMTELSQTEQRRIWINGIDAMSNVHSLDINSELASEFITSFDFPTDLNQQLDYWERYAQWTFEGLPSNPVCDQAIAWLKNEIVSEQQLAFCWGDARLPNVIYELASPAVAALLDWEMLALGDPAQDLAWWLYLDELFSSGAGQARLEGFPGKEETIQRWQHNTGFRCDHMDYYTIFAGLRFSLIFSRIMICMGSREIAMDNFSSQFLQQKLALQE